VARLEVVKIVPSTGAHARAREAALRVARRCCSRRERRERDLPIAQAIRTARMFANVRSDEHVLPAIPLSPAAVARADLAWMARAILVMMQLYLHGEKEAKHLSHPWGCRTAKSAERR
jgi:hypothetical protein